MNKVLQRLATFFIGIPLVVVIVALPYFNYLAIHITVTIFALLGAVELYEIFQKNSPLLPKALVIFFSFSLPLLSYIVFAFKLSPHIIELVFVLEILFLLSFNSITKKTFSDTNLATSLSSLIVLYVGYFSTFITRIYNFTNGVYFIALFLVMVFMCDSIAWLFGMTLGKTNRGILAVSPNKSIAGFIGGYTGSVLSAIIITKLFCDIYASSLLNWIICALVTSTASIAGDLVESSFKRCSNVKDSGHLMPGRGGILDSIDSILFAAPVFYAMLFILFGDLIHSQ